MTAYTIHYYTVEAFIRRSSHRHTLTDGKKFFGLDTTMMHDRAAQSTQPSHGSEYGDFMPAITTAPPVQRSCRISPTIITIQTAQIIHQPTFKTRPYNTQNETQQIFSYTCSKIMTGPPAAMQ